MLFIDTKVSSTITCIGTYARPKRRYVIRIGVALLAIGLLCRAACSQAEGTTLALLPAEATLFGPHATQQLLAESVRR